MLILLRSLLVSFFWEKIINTISAGNVFKKILSPGTSPLPWGAHQAIAWRADRGWELILYPGGCMNPIRGGLWCLKIMSDYNSDTIFYNFDEKCVTASYVAYLNVSQAYDKINYLFLFGRLFMSYLSDLLNRINEIQMDYQCPDCKMTSKQNLRDIRQGRVIICPHCKASSLPITHFKK
ncbi:YnfU family zinc-binding protein [Sodalis ligni]|uniref:YnfU family zinc-binding protein n=1 Tax=Sodalis ligni TaxID=2697027 RepID=UPI001050915C|nr:YnfU family zinc-binding protein [Sodalis ligni]